MFVAAQNLCAPFPPLFSNPPCFGQPSQVGGFPDMFVPGPPASGIYGPMWPVPCPPRVPEFQPSPNYPSGITSVIYTPGLPAMVYDVFGPPPIQSSAGLTLEQKQTIMQSREQDFNDRMAYWKSLDLQQRQADEERRKAESEEDNIGHDL